MTSDANVEQHIYTAFHEAGHVVMAHLTGYTLRDPGVRLYEESGGWSGMTYIRPVCDLQVAAASLRHGDHQLRLGTISRIEAELRITMAGPVAEALVRGMRLSGRITGFGGEHGDTTTCERYVALITESRLEAESVLYQAQRRVARILRRRMSWVSVKAIAACLQTDGSLSPERAEQILAPGLGPPPRYARWPQSLLARWGYPVRGTAG